MGLERKLLGGAIIKNHARRWLCSGSVGLQRGCSSAAPPELPPFDYEPKPYSGPRADEVLEKRKRYLGPSLFHYYQKPVSPSTNSLHAIFVVCLCLWWHRFDDFMLLWNFNSIDSFGWKVIGIKILICFMLSFY